MTVIDISLLVLLGGFVLAGFWFGLIHMTGALVGTVLGAVLASRFFEPLAQWLHGIAGGNLNLLRILSMLAVYVLVNHLVGFVVLGVDRVFRVIAIVPFMKTFNRLLGAALGLLEGVLVLGLLVFFAARFPVTPAFELVLRNSEVARLLNLAGSILAPLLPEAVRAIRSVL